MSERLLEPIPGTDYLIYSQSNDSNSTIQIYDTSKFKVIYDSGILPGSKLANGLDINILI